MQSHKYLLGLSLLLILGVAACMPQPTLRSELFLDDRSLVSQEPCGAPCWNNIVPGETNWQTALEIVQQTPGLANVEVNEEGGLIQAVWQKEGSDQFCCRLLADGEESPVTYLFLALSPEMVLDNVLSVYGEPVYVTTFDFTDAESVIQLVYPDVPMVVSVLVGDAQGSVLANSDVVAVLYTSPDEMELILDTTELQGWVGYQSYAAYNQATPVVTPRVTLTPATEE